MSQTERALISDSDNRNGKSEQMGDNEGVTRIALHDLWIAGSIARHRAL